MASIKVENNKKKKSGTAAASSANNMTLNEKESGLLMAIASLLGDAPQVIGSHISWPPCTHNKPPSCKAFVFHPAVPAI